jgi:hypothetical protein
VINCRLILDQLQPPETSSALSLGCSRMVVGPLAMPLSRMSWVFRLASRDQ